MSYLNPFLGCIRQKIYLYLQKRTPSDIITDSITNNKIDRSKANLIKDIATICVEDTKYQEINLTQ